MRFDFGHSTANWHDIPCSLGSHTQVVKSANVWLNNSVFSDLVNSYICKLDALTEIIEPKFVQTPMYKSLKVVSKETVYKSVNKQRNFICSNLEVISFLQKCDGVAQCKCLEVWLIKLFRSTFPPSSLVVTYVILSVI